MIITEKQYFPAVNGLRITATFHESRRCEITFMLLYRKQSSNLHCFLNSLTNILYQHSVDAVLGDFNVNYFNKNESRHLRNTLEATLGFQQIVQKPTFVSRGSLLDHVYLRPEKFKTVSTTTISVYYSDHDAVKISFYL